MGVIEAARAVTFDFGQTLAELDAEMLSRRLREKGITLDAGNIDRAVPAAWRAYNEAIQQGLGGHPWHLLMHRILEGAGLTNVNDDLVEWLWQEQPRQNLWRKPIKGMFELLDHLATSGVPLGIISNSEGRLAELADELGIRASFRVIADSGKLGIPKPDRRIFEWTAAELGVPLNAIVHVGDAFAADVEGALAVGMRSVWFGGDATEAAKLGSRVRVAHDAQGTKAVLDEWLGIARP